MDINITNKGQALKFLQKVSVSTETAQTSSIDLAKTFFSKAELRKLNPNPPIIVNSCFCKKRPELLTSEIE